MDPRLARIVMDVNERVQSNPSDDDLEVDAGTLLQLEILKSGVEFSEADVLLAAENVGVDEENLIDWLEGMASWV